MGSTPVNPKGNQLWILIGRKLKLQYFGHLMQTANSLEKTLMLKKFENRRQRERQTSDGITDSMRWWGTGKPGMLHFKGSQRVGYNLATELQQQQHHQWKAEQFQMSLLSRLLSQPCQKFSGHFRSFSKRCLRTRSQDTLVAAPCYRQE